jgi:hypothetical protein
MAKEYAMTIEVPEFDEKEAYDHDRPISSLIRTQLQHLQAAEHMLGKKDHTHININRLHTEREASEYIQKVTAKLHPLDKPAKRKAAAGKSKTRKKAAKKTGKAARRKVPGKKAAKAKSAAKKRK